MNSRGITGTRGTVALQQCLVPELVEQLVEGIKTGSSSRLGVFPRSASRIALRTLARQTRSHVWFKRLTIRLCASTVIPSLVTLLTVPSTPFPPIFSSPTASLTPLTASLTPLTGIRLNPCATLLWGWTIWSSERSEPKHSSRHMFWPLHPGAASERTGVLVPMDSMVASKVWTEQLIARTCFSVLSCRVCASTFNPHMHMRVAQG